MFPERQRREHRGGRGGSSPLTVVFRRAGRRTNVALLIVLVGAFLTGWAAFAAGTEVPSRVATIGHGLFGLGVVALVPWKTVVVRRAGGLRLLSLGLAAVIVICLVAGFVEVFAGYGLVAGISPIQVHVGTACVAVPLLVWHLVRHRRGQVPRRADLSRRRLLRTAGFAVGIGAAYAALEGAGRVLGLPSGRRIASGSHRIAPGAVPATSWLFDRVPAVPADHVVRIDATDVPVTDLDARAVPVAARLDCTSGWFADAEWSGVALSTLLPAERLTGASILVTSVTGYRRRFPVADAGNLWLATRFEGRPLRRGTGSPVRLVAPGRRGFWWVKWVATVELSDTPAYAQSPFPLQ